MYVLNSNLFFIGELSEEAQESRNKDFKRIREHNTRKISRICQNEDLIHMLLISSDPYISSLRSIPTKKIVEFDEAAQKLVINVKSDSNCSTSSSDSEKDYFVIP